MYQAERRNNPPTDATKIWIGFELTFIEIVFIELGLGDKRYLLISIVRNFFDMTKAPPYTTKFCKIFYAFSVFFTYV